MLIQSDSIDLKTPTGNMRTYVHRPNKKGKFPVILFYSEIFQQTGPIERAAKIVASHGYAVLVPEVFQKEILTKNLKMFRLMILTINL